MTLLGQKKDGLNMTVCDKFEPEVLEGQLCYSLNLSSIEVKKTGQGKRAGLTLLIDPGGQLSHGSQNVRINMEDTLDLEYSRKDDSSARIYLNTLSSFTDYRSGSYAMTVLKKMTGTESFLKQTDKEKKCRIETLEHCLANGFVENVQQRCGCVPWTLTSALLPLQVNLTALKSSYRSYRRMLA